MTKSYKAHLFLYHYPVSCPPCLLQVHMCVKIHQSVAEKSLQFKAELSRHNYVTPTSYLELLGMFSKMIKLKKNEISTQRNRTKSGLDKVTTNDCNTSLNQYKFAWIFVTRRVYLVYMYSLIPSSQYNLSTCLILFFYYSSFFYSFIVSTYCIECLEIGLTCCFFSFFLFASS